MLFSSDSVTTSSISGLLMAVLSKPVGLITVACLALVTYLVAKIVNNVFFHPLRKYPGPKLWAATRIPFSRAYLSGEGHLKIAALHANYGPVVRIAPTELSFCYPKAWEEIMGHRKKGEAEYSKDPDFWVDHRHTMIGATRENHGRHRRILAHGFSNQAMVAQQPLIQSYISLLIQRLKEAAETGESQDMVVWYNWTTFDIIGDLSFGEPFGCLENTKHHFWIDIIFQQLQGVALLTTIRKFPGWKLLVKLLMTKEKQDQYAEHFQLAKNAIDKRLALNIERNDFVDSMAAAKEKGQMTEVEILHNTQNLVLGGSETTATSLAATTYLLCTHADVLAKLTKEKLSYMTAVIDEALRVFPAVPPAIPRITGEEGGTIHGDYVSPNTMLSIWQWAMSRSPEHFKDPELFIPERFLDDPRFDSDQKAAFQPFSYGPRNCIGKNLAYAEMRLILARVIWNFDMKLDPRSEGWMERNRLYLLWEKPELFITLVPRKIEV